MRSRPHLSPTLLSLLVAACAGDDGATASAGESTGDLSTGAASTSSASTSGSTSAATSGGATGTSAATTSSSGESTSSSGESTSSSGESTSSSAASEATTDDPTSSSSTGTSTTDDSSTDTSAGLTEGMTTGGDPECGDGVVDVGEECDEGAQNGDDAACTGACTLAFCGDGLVYAGVEACDDGNADPEDACDDQCQLTGSRILWQEFITGGGGSSRSARAIAIDGAGNALVAGYRGAPNLEYAWLRKISPAGATLWERDYADKMGQGWGVAVGAADSAWLTGRTIGIGDLLVLHYTSAGALLHADAFDFEGKLDRGWAVTTDANGRAYVTGMVTGAMLSDERLVLRAYNDNNTLVYSKVGPVPFVTNGLGVDVAANGDLVVAGTWKKDGDQDLWVGRFTAAAAPIWSYNEGDFVYTDTANAITAGADGSIYAAGAINGGKTDAWLRKHSGAGAHLWTHVHSNPGQLSEHAHGVAVDSKGDVVIVGVDDSNAWIRKLSPAGVVQWTEIHDDAAWAAAYAVAIDAQDHIWVAGQRKGNQIWVARLAP